MMREASQPDSYTANPAVATGRKAVTYIKISLFTFSLIGLKESHGAEERGKLEDGDGAKVNSGGDGRMDNGLLL